MAIVYIVYEICRLVFLAVNWSMFSDSLTWQAFGEMLVGGWFFDTSAILYTNALYALLMLFPIHYKESALYQKVAKWVFVVVNAVSIVANLTDCVYFQYTTRRTTGTVFSEFKNENNLGSIFGVELLRHWYLVLIGVALIVALWYFYRMPKGERPEAEASLQAETYGKILCRADGLSCCLRAFLCCRYARRIHYSRASHHHQQCQPVCGASTGSGYCIKHSFFYYPYHRQAHL